MLLLNCILFQLDVNLFGLMLFRLLTTCLVLLLLLAFKLAPARPNKSTVCFRADYMVKAAKQSTALGFLASFSSFIWLFLLSSGQWRVAVFIPLDCGQDTWCPLVMHVLSLPTTMSIYTTCYPRVKLSWQESLSCASPGKACPSLAPWKAWPESLKESLTSFVCSVAGYASMQPTQTDTWMEALQKNWISKKSRRRIRSHENLLKAEVL